MSAFDVLDRFGTAALLRFLGAVAMFVLLHLIRLPFVVLARLLEVGMRRVDAYLTSAITARQEAAQRPPQRPPDGPTARPRFHMPAGMAQTGAAA